MSSSDSSNVMQMIFLNEKAALWAIFYGPILAIVFMFVLRPMYDMFCIWMEQQRVKAIVEENMRNYYERKRASTAGGHSPQTQEKKRTSPEAEALGNVVDATPRRRSVNARKSESLATAPNNNNNEMESAFKTPFSVASNTSPAASSSKKSQRASTHSNTNLDSAEKSPGQRSIGELNFSLEQNVENKINSMNNYLLSPSRMEVDDFTVVGTSMKIRSSGHNTTNTNTATTDSNVLELPKELRKRNTPSASPGRWIASIASKVTSRRRRPTTTASAESNSNTATGADMPSAQTSAFLEEAIASGDIVFTPPAVPSIVRYDNDIQKLFRRLRARQEYRRQTKQETKAQLQALFESEAFQQWYGENREGLLEEVQLRHRGVLFRGVGSMTALLVIFYVLPFFSFGYTSDPSQQTRASPFTILLNPAGAVKEKGSHFAWGNATFMDLIARRLSFLQDKQAVSFTQLQSSSSSSNSNFSLDVLRVMCVYLFHLAHEWVIIAGLCTLITAACYMPGRNKNTASVALGSMCFLLYEVLQVAPAGEAEGRGAWGISIGMGFLALTSLVAGRIFKAISEEASTP